MRISDWSSDVCSSDLPRRTETARRYEHLPVRPGGDGWLLAGVSRVIIDENLEDRAFLDAHCSGLPTFVEALRSFDLEDCADQSGVSAADIRRLARDLAAAPSGFIRSEEHTSELQSLMRISYAVFCLKKKK